MRVCEWMSSELVSLSPDDPAQKAFDAMREQGIRHVLVRNGEELVGMVSDRDLVRVTLQNAGRILDIEGCSVSDVMTPSPLVVVEPNAELSQAARLLCEHQISALPVEQHGEVVGLICASDLMRTFFQKEDAF